MANLHASKADRIIEQHPDFPEWVVRSLLPYQINDLFKLYQAGITADQMQTMARLVAEDL